MWKQNISWKSQMKIVGIEFKTISVLFKGQFLKFNLSLKTILALPQWLRKYKFGLIFIKKQKKM